MAEIQSLARGLKVLQILADSQDSVSVTEIAAALQVDKSSASRIIQTLVTYEWAKPESGSRGYRLGPRFSLLYHARIDYDQLQQVARPFLHYLVEETGECAHIAIHLNGMTYVLDDIESDTILRVTRGVGRTTYLHCTAIGKVLLAFADIPLPESLEKFTEHTRTTEKKLKVHLDDIRINGYAVDDEELTIGVRCLAVPVYNHVNQCIASIGVSGPAVRVNKDTIPDMVAVLKGTGIELSCSIGYKNHSHPD